MSRGPLTFKEKDLTRAVRAVKKAGCEVAKAEIENGKMTIVIGKPVEPGGEAPTNEWDEVNGGNQTKARQ